LLISGKRLALATPGGAPSEPWYRMARRRIAVLGPAPPIRLTHPHPGAQPA